MKKIGILGPGCARCKQLSENAEEAARQLGLAYELEKVTELDRILESGIMMTPALVVDGEVKVFGRVPSVAEVKSLLS
ncbi:MAG: thioredoxin family protein [Acidobacteriota bacterium]